MWDVLNHRFKALANRPFESVSPKELFVYCIKLSRNLQPMRIGYFGCLCLLVELQSAYPVHFAVNASMDRAFCCLYPVHYAVNGKIDRAICCLFPVYYAVNGNIDRAIYCHFPVHYAVNASVDRDLLLYIKVHCLYWRMMKSGRTI